jgi:hypothetical protein
LQGKFFAARREVRFCKTKFLIGVKISPVLKTLGMSKPQPPLTLVGPGSTAPPPPRKLAAPGLSLWSRIQSEYAISDAGGIEILCLAAQALDRAESLSASITADGETIRTRTGVRAHPALRDELANRALVARLLTKLGINVEPIKSPGRPGIGLGWTPPT